MGAIVQGQPVITLRICYRSPRNADHHHRNAGHGLILFIAYRSAQQALIFVSGKGTPTGQPSTSDSAIDAILGAMASTGDRLSGGKNILR